MLLTAMVGFGPISTDLYLPSLPILGALFQAPVATVQLTLSVFLLGFAFSQLAYGPLSDRIGRRPVAIAGLVIYVLASIACALAWSIEALIAFRLVQAVGACCGPVIGRAIVRDVYGRERATRMLAYMAAAMALAPAIGPVLGGYLTLWLGWRANFWVLAGFGGLVLAGVLATLRETNLQPDPRATSPRQIVRNYRQLLGNRAFVGYVVVVAFCYSAIFSFISGSSFVLMGGLGLAPNLYGLCFGAVVVGYIAGSFTAGALAVRLGARRLVRLGTVVSAAGGLLMAGLAAGAPGSVPAIVGPFVLAMIGLGLALPTAMAGAIGPFGSMAGLASSLAGFARITVAALVGIVVGQFTTVSALPMALAVFVTTAVSLAAARLLLLR